MPRARRSSPWTRMPRSASTHRSVRGGTLSREPTLSALSPRATCLTRMGRPNRPVPPGLWRRRRTPPRLAASLCPCLNSVTDVCDGHDLLPKARAPINGAKLAATPWASRAELPSHWFFRPPPLQASPIGSVGTPAAAPFTDRAAPSPALRLLRPHLLVSAVPAHRYCVHRK
jgi:hypothetical protein